MDLGSVMTEFTKICIQGAENVKPYAFSILWVLAVIDLALLSSLNMLGGGENPIFFISKKALKYGFFYFLIDNWATGMMLTDNIFKMFDMMGAKAAGASNSQYASGELGKQGIILAESIFTNIYNLGISNLGAVVINILIGILVFLGFVFLAAYIFVTKLQFYIVATLTIVLLPFGVNKFTSFLSEKVIGAIFSLGIKIMTLQFVLCLTLPQLINVAPVKPLTASVVNIGEILGILVFVGALIYLTISAPTLASDMLSGSPSLGDSAASGAVNTGKAAASAAAGAVTGGVGAVMSGAGMAKAAMNAEGGRNPGGSINLGGTARNLGAILRQNMPDRSAQTRANWSLDNSKALKKDEVNRNVEQRQGAFDFK